MVKQTIQIFARVKPSVRKQQQGIYSIDEDEKLASSLEIVLPRDLADGFVNNKRESYKFKFQRIFDQEAKQEIIFEIIAKPVAERCQQITHRLLRPFTTMLDCDSYLGIEAFPSRYLRREQLRAVFACASTDSSTEAAPEHDPCENGRPQ